MSKPSAPKFRIRLLVVDDEHEITEFLVRHFSFLGYDITGINDPKAALKMIEQENFHIVISDIVMPGFDGLELLKRIKQHNGGIQVIMITGYVTIHNIIMAMRRGAETVLFKPLHDLNKLEEAIKRCIAKINMWQDILRELGALAKADQ